MSLQRFFQKYTGKLRNLKAVYVINNLLNADRLKHNRPLYRRYGLRKSIYSPIGSSDFKAGHHPDIPWLDRPGALETLEQHPDFQHFSAEWQAAARLFVEKGYLILRNVFSEADTDALNAEVDQLLQAGKVGYNYTGRKITNLWETSALANERFFRNPELLRLLEFLLGKKNHPLPYAQFYGRQRTTRPFRFHPHDHRAAGLPDCHMDCFGGLHGRLRPLVLLPG